MIDEPVKLHIFNPENDLALADGSANYFAPSAAMYIAHDLATLPLWFAVPGDAVLLPSMLHHEFCADAAKYFNIATAYNETMRTDVTEISPWGWSPQMHRRISAMGFVEKFIPSAGEIVSIRNISNRRTSIVILESLEKCGIEVNHYPHYFTEPSDVYSFICSRPRCVVKAPWSGSGKGIAWGIGRVEPPMEHFYRGVIKRQGGVICEDFLRCELEFAMEFSAGNNGVEFAGYSLFNSVKGSYSGNILASDYEIEARLAKYMPVAELYKVRGALADTLTEILKDCGYKGYLGVDMMLYKENEEVFLNPCMELNLRMNMGMATRLIFDNHVHPTSTGEFFVAYYKNGSEALEMHNRNRELYRLKIENRKIKSGYINFSPVTAESKYVAYAIIEE